MKKIIYADETVKSNVGYKKKISLKWRNLFTALIKDLAC